MTNSTSYPVHVEHDTIFVAGVKSGFIFTDPDEPGVFVEMPGAICKRFRNRNNVSLWLIKHAEEHFPKVREHLIRKMRHFRFVGVAQKIQSEYEARRHQ